MKISRSPLVALFVLLFAVAGCGGGSSGSTGRSVQGLVVNERGHPVSGAEVSLLADGRSHLAPAATATTSVDGSFQLTDVPAGNYTLSVRVDGPRGVTVEVQILVSVPDDSDLDIDIRVDFTGSDSGVDLVDTQNDTGVITGMVFDQDQNSLSGAQITATHLPSKQVRRVTTDSRGAFELDDLPAGPWRLSAIWGDFTGRPVTLVVKADTAVQTDLFLSRPNGPPDNFPGKGKGKGHLKGLRKGHKK